MRKMYALFLAVSFIVQGLCLSVSAGNKEDWQISYNGSFTDITPRNEYIGEIRTDSVYEGFRALYVNCYALSKNENDYIEVKNQLTEIPLAGEYELKLYVKPGQWGKYTGSFEVTFGDETFTVDAGVGEKHTAPSGETGWVEKTFTFSYDGNGDGNLYIRAYYALLDVYIDEITLTRKDINKNIVYDPGFEDYIIPGTGDEEEVPYDRTDYLPGNLMISNGTKVLGISWVNPATSELEKISLYDTTGGEDVLLSDEFTVSPGECVVHKVTDLKDNTLYTYKLVFSFAGKGDEVYYLSRKPSAVTGYPLGRMVFAQNTSTAAGYCPGTVGADNTIGYESDSSIKFVSNIRRDIAELNSNVYLRFTATLDFMEIGKTYEMSYMIKTENSGRVVKNHMSWNAFDNTGSMSVENTIGTNDWTAVKRTYTHTGTTTNFMIIVDDVCEGIWIDKLEVYEIDSDGNRVSENLYPEGDFEDETLLRTESIAKTNVEALQNSAVISWSSPAESYAGSYIYRKVFDDFELCGYIADSSSVRLDNLEKDSDCTYMLVPVNGYGISGEGVEVNFRTALDDYELTEPIIMKNGETVNSISGAGRYTVLVNAKNNKTEGGLPCELIVAIFDGKDMTDVYSSEKNIPVTDKNASHSNVYVSFELTEDKEYRADVYLVDCRDNMNVYYYPVKY